MKKYITAFIVGSFIASPIMAAELPKSLQVERYGETGALEQRAPKVTVLSSDPRVLRHIEAVRRQMRAPRVTSAQQLSPRNNVEVIQLESAIKSSAVVNVTNNFIFQNITPADTGAQQSNITRVSTTERMQRVELFRRSLAIQKKSKQ